MAVPWVRVTAHEAPDGRTRALADDWLVSTPEVQDFDEAMAYVGHMRAIDTTVAYLTDMGAK
eukprot:8494045-Alexandrium_andersonii.AAC.1